MPAKKKSLIRRAVASVLFAQLICAAVLCAAALLHEHHSRFRALDTRVQGRSDSLLGAVQDAEDPEDNVTVDPAELKLPDEDVWAVYNQGGRLLGTSANAPIELIKRMEDGYHNARTSHTRYRVFQRQALRIIDRAEYGGVGLRRPITIVYASPESHVWHEIFEAASYYLLTILLVTGAVSLLVTALLRRSLQPLMELADAAATLSAPALVFVPPASALELTELHPLAEVLESSIASLREFFARERQFYGDAAHELKTATAVVRSSAQLLLLRQRTEQEYSAGLERIVEDTHRLEGLVGQMLQLARVVEEKTSMESTRVDLSEIARTTANLLHPVAEERSVQIILDAPQKNFVRLQNQSAHSLLSNLLLNAIQYSDSASTVRVRVSKAAGNVELKISDEGVGIGDEALPHIFDRFYREDESRSRATGGTGLGLAIVKSIVDSANGSISVKTVKDTGTTITVTFTAA